MAAHELWRTLAATWDLRTATRGGPAGVAARQRRRAAALVAHAREHSPYYRDHYAAVPADGDDATLLRRLPPTSKPELMAEFDRWVTDPAVRRADVERFVSDPERVGELLLDRYAVWTTSGTTGIPGLFLHDRTAQAVYQALVVRLY